MIPFVLNIIFGELSILSLKMFEFKRVFFFLKSMYDKGNNDKSAVFHCHGWLVVWSLSSHSRIFHLYGDGTIAGERLQILTYAHGHLAVGVI